jgi:hypothetical protein
MPAVHTNAAVGIGAHRDTFQSHLPERRKEAVVAATAKTAVKHNRSHASIEFWLAFGNRRFAVANEGTAQICPGSSGSGS